MIESAGKAAIIQAGLNFRGMGIPSGFVGRPSLLGVPCAQPNSIHQ